MNNYQPTAVSREAMSRIRGLIARFDVPQADLAVLCDVSQSQFSKMVRGVRPMTLDQLVVVLDALGQDTGEFLSEIDAFLVDRGVIPSPIRYVLDGEREENPTPFSAALLDPWGRAALDRLPKGVVSGPEDDRDADHQHEYDLAARPRAKDRGEDTESYDA